MMDDHVAPDQRNEQEPLNSNHVIWGMTIGVVLGSIVGLVFFDNGAVGVVIGVVLGFILSIGLRLAMK